MSVNPFDVKESAPTISWAITDSFGNKSSVPVGTTQGGRVWKSPEIVQSTGYVGTPFAGRPLFWSNEKTGKTDQPKSSDGRDNQPVTQIVIGLTVDGVDKSLWVSKYPKSMFDAIQAAIKDGSGKTRAIEIGDELYITLTGFERSEDAGKAASKLYSARFVKGAGAFAPDPTAATAIPAPPSPVATPAPPAGVIAEPLLSNGFTASALKASGWTDAQISALSAPVAPAPPAAPVAGPEAPAASERDRRLAEMSPEDRALLNL